MKKALLVAMLASAAAVAIAKLPPPDAAAQAKAAEAKAKAAWEAKVDAYELCKAQNRVVAFYRKSAGSGSAKPPAATSAKSSAPAASSSAPATSTPVAASPPPPCADPGPFAFNPPEQKPLETSEAHSPAGTAASPPSVKAHSGIIQAPKKP